MIGTGRQCVSVAAALKEKSVIRYSRGTVGILNRKKREALACVRYGVIQQWNGELGLK